MAKPPDPVQPPELVPPTDVRTTYTPAGLAIERLHAKADARRDAGRYATGLASINAKSSYNPASAQMYVRPADATRAVLDRAGDPYPPDGCFVASDDVHAHRRLRDGGLVIADPP